MARIVERSAGTLDDGTPVRWVVRVLLASGEIREIVADHDPTDDELLAVIGTEGRGIEPSTGVGRSRDELLPILLDRATAMAGVEAAKQYALRQGMGAGIQAQIDAVEADVFSRFAAIVQKYQDAS